MIERMPGKAFLAAGCIAACLAFGAVVLLCTRPAGEPDHDPGRHSAGADHGNPATPRPNTETPQPAGPTPEVDLSNMSNFRRLTVGHTAKLTVPELVDDLGEIKCARMGAGLRSIVFTVYSESVMSAYLPRNVQVARLIEEGRRNPALVGDLCAKRLARLADGYEEMYWQMKSVTLEQMNSGEQSDLVVRYMRESYAASALVYVMLNIEYDQIHHVMAKLMRKPMRNGAVASECAGLNLWAMDQSIVRFADTDDPKVKALVAEYERLLGIHVDELRTVREEKVGTWNAAWPVGDHMLEMAGADQSELPTTTVKLIPPILEGYDKGSLSASRINRVKRQFVKIADEMKW